MESLLEILHRAIRLLESLWAVDYGEALFLPRGKGPSILILGGLSMLAASLYLSLRAPDGRPDSASPAPGGTGPVPAGGRASADGHPEPATGRLPSRPRQVQAALAVARRANLGPPRLVSADPDRHAIALPTCPGHHAPGSTGPDCERAREILERGLHARGRPARVVRSSRHEEQGGPCVFEILPGAPSS